MSAQNELDEAARRISTVVNGLIQLWQGGPEQTVNNGNENLPTIAKFLADAGALIQSQLGDFSAAAASVVELADEVAEDAATVAVAVTTAQEARDLALNIKGIYRTTADALSQGVQGYTALVGGSGGANGTFDIAFSGGAGTGAAGRFTVTGGALTSILITSKGTGYTSEPAMSFAASAGLTGASATAIIAPLTANNELFAVLADGADQVYKVYRNNAGSAEDTTKSALDSRSFFTDSQLSGRVALATDDSGKVPLWLDDGLLGSGGLAPSLMAWVQANLQGLLTATPDGYPPFVIYSELDEKVVLVINEDGVQWFGDAPNSGGDDEAPEVVLPPQGASQGLSLFRWRAKLAKILQSNAGTARMVFFGDSWSERTEIVQQVATGLYTLYGQAGPGWVSVDSDRMVPVNALNGITFAKGGSFAISDTNVTNSHSMDSFFLVDNGTTGTLQITNFQAEVIKIFYHNGTGTFRYRIDGGAWTTVAGTNTGVRSTITVSGLADAAHTLDIDTTPNTGSVRLYGFHGSRSAAGVEINKCGRGGATSTDIDLVMALQANYLVDFPPDIVAIILGTNDAGAGITKATYKGHLYSIIQKCKAVAPDASYLLIAPARNGNAMLTDMTEYRDAIIELAADETNVEYFNLHDLVAGYTTMNAADIDIWYDTGHLSPDGGRLTFSELNKRLLGAH